MKRGHGIATEGTPNVQREDAMNRRQFLASTLAVTGGAGMAASMPAGAAARKPNIVIIVSDDQGYGDVSYAEHHPQEVETPNIDRLAMGGVRLTNGYVSGYVCAPSRAGFMTGRYQQRFGFYTGGDSRPGMSLEESTLADFLKKDGYATGIFGKWHLGIEPEKYHPLKRGFDEFYGFLGHGAHDYFDLKIPTGEKEHNSLYRNEEKIDDTGYLTDNLARESVAFIEAHKEEPFFLYLPFNAVHVPLQAPEEDIARFENRDKDRNAYLAMLRRMDLAVGQVVDKLEEAGVEDNTLVFFFSDNGGARANKANNGKLHGFKHSYYEGGVRVPFIVKWPGRLPVGASCDEPISSLDILPSLCAMLGITLPSDRVYDGKDIFPALLGKAKDPLHEILFWDDGEAQWAVRAEEWKLLSIKGTLELYNLDKDLSELNNLASKEPEVVARLQQAYADWKKEMKPSTRGTTTKEEKKAARRRGAERL